MIRLSLKVIPNASIDEVAGYIGNALKVKVRVQPEKGKASKAVIQLICKTLNIPKSVVVVVFGATSSNKIVEISNTTQKAIDALLGVKN